MITINKGQVNEVWLTLAEYTTISNPRYLFVFTNDTTKKEVRFICSFTSNAEYSVFNITESNTPNFLNGVVTLNPTGFWSYEVYQQSSATNLDPSLSQGKVESGKVQVIGTPYTNSIYENQNTTNEVYING